MTLDELLETARARSPLVIKAVQDALAGQKYPLSLVYEHQNSPLFQVWMPSPMQQRVIVGMSGGVDSSVSAALLLQQGYQVEGLFMKNWEEDDGTEYCTAMEDLADAQAVCDKLGIKLHTANFAMEYWDRVFRAFLSGICCRPYSKPRYFM